MINCLLINLSAEISKTQCISKCAKYSAEDGMLLLKRLLKKKKTHGNPKKIEISRNYCIHDTVLSSMTC